MSALSTITLICDRCYEDASFETSSRKKAREFAQISGWRVGQKPTTHEPSLHDVKVDICLNCLREAGLT